MVVTAFGLDGLDNDGADWMAEGLDEMFRLFKTALFLLGVLGSVLIERIFEERKRGLRPVESGNVEFVDGLAASGGERAEKPAMESSFEGQDGEVRRAR